MTCSNLRRAAALAALVVGSFLSLSGLAGAQGQPPAPAGTAAPAAPAAGEGAGVQKMMEGDEGAMSGAAYTYDPAGRRDPFKSLLVGAIVSSTDAAAVFSGRHGAVTRQAEQSECSRERNTVCVTGAEQARDPCGWDQAIEHIANECKAEEEQQQLFADAVHFQNESTEGDLWFGRGRLHDGG